MSSSVLLSVLGIIRTPNGRPLWRFAAANIVLTLALWGAFANGARDYYSAYRDLARSVVVGQVSYFSSLDHARLAFETTGGGTSFVQPNTVERAALSEDGEKLGEKLAAPRPSERVGSLARGLAVLFLPISILRGWHIVDFQGGRGLLMVTDLDTVVIDVTLVACLYLSLRRRRVSMMPAELCVTVLAALMILLLAYVVTNYGTLFRLRLLAVAPLWLLPAVLDSDDERPAR